MDAMRESWTDERLDDFRSDVNRRFDAIDRRFDHVVHELQRINDRLDAMQRTMVHGFAAMTVAMMTGYAATIGLVVTQL
jgi:tetrahydromethanopterin S-methyltransferase subunit G